LNSEVELTAESIAHGGASIARMGSGSGQVVFLSGAAPGDRVLAQLSPSADPESRYLRAKTLRVLEAGPHRVAAPCPIVDRCGGCPIQHVKYETQLEAKRALTIDALVRTGGIADAAAKVEPIAASPQQFGYRRRARMHRAPDGSWGFAGVESATKRLQATILPVEKCLLFEPKLQELADVVRPAIAELGGIPEATDLGLLVDSEGRGAIDLRTAAAPTARVRHRVEQLVRKLKILRGVTVGPLGSPLLIGEPTLADAPVELHGGKPFRLRTRPDLFAQANRSILPVFQSSVLKRLGPAAQGRVLELFCGAGSLTLPLLAAGARAVIGVEDAGPSLSLLRKSAEENGLAAAPDPKSEPRLKLMAGDAAQITASLRAVERGRLDAVLLDPPRTGAPAAVRAAAELQAKRIVYVSCDAPTLGRDAKQLGLAGYRLTSAQPLDLFPQTAHFEVVALFERE
jgi:23S rRNA (uracil1939-C5)-methyltransferase